MNQKNQIIHCFKQDCNDLVKSFVSSSKPCDFKRFCNVWKSMNFHYIFFGYSTNHELLHFLDDAFLTVKHEFLNAENTITAIGFLYLMYALYFKQPTKEYTKFRFTVDEWEKMMKFYGEINDNYQAKLILWKLLTNEGIRFVEAENEYGFEVFMYKDQEKNKNEIREFEKYSNILKSEFMQLKNEKNGIIPALEILQVGYNEMKEHLDTTGPTTGLLPSTKLMNEILEGIQNIENNFKIAPIVDSITNSETSSDDCDNFGELDIGSKRIKLKRNKTNRIKEPKTESEIVDPAYKCTIKEEDDIVLINRPTKTFARDFEKEIQQRTVLKQLEPSCEVSLELDESQEEKNVQSETNTESLPLL